MTTSHIQAVIPGDVHRVWSIVTAVENYAAWRGDLSKVEVLDETRFVEHTRGGYITTFTTTLFQPCERWEFDSENDNLTGHWIGIFTPRGADTQVDFTQSVCPKKLYMRPFVRPYMKKQQARFISDLREAVLCHKGG